MSDIYVFGPSEDSNDYSTMGLVGALVPTECMFDETANGDSILTLSHPLDEYGRYAALKKGNILVTSVPVRLTPEISGNKIVTTVWTYEVKPHNQLTHKNQRTLFKKSSGSSKRAVMTQGDQVTVVEKPDGENVRWRVKSIYGDGWIIPEGFKLITQHNIKDNSSSIETSQSSWKLKRQYFRIQDVQKSLDSVKVTARHITYDLLTNKTDYKSTTAVPLPTALDGIMSNCYAPHEFEVFTNIMNEQSGLDYILKNPIDAFLNPETGICALYAVSIIRDNYSIYFLKDPGVNRDVRIQYRKNMLGINVTDSDESVVTRVIPIGEDKNGKNLYLSDDKTGRYVDSPNISKYPVIRVAELKCENCKVGDKDPSGSTITAAIARQRMQQQAKDYIANGCDKPKIDMSVEFVNLGDTEEYAQFKDLENCFTYDYIIIQHPELGIDVTSQIMQISWNVLSDRMKSVQIGSIGKTLANTGITTWQIPSGFSGSKIAGDTIGSSALRDDIINVRHMQADSVNTEALQAGSITSEKIQAGVIEVGSIEAMIAKIASLTADSIKTDRLAAALADFNVITAGSADFDRATIKHLVAEAMSLEFGTAEQVYIRNLAVGYAQMIGAAIGELCIKSSEGDYYLIDVDQNGNITATKTTLSNGEITSGQTSGGKVILETNITANNLNTNTLLATYALINKIDASRIDVDSLFARQAFIDKLVTTEISGTDTITMIANRSNKSFRQEEMPMDGIKPGDTWRKPSTGETYQAEDLSKYGLSFYLGSDGGLYYEFSEEVTDVTIEMQDYDLIFDGLIIQIDEKGNLLAPVRWVLVQDMGMMSKLDFDHYVRIKPDGLHVGTLIDPLTGAILDEPPGEVVIDYNSVDVVLGGTTYSSFASNYVEFGNYQLRKSADGGLVFKLR